jgi:hypothetical protein
MRRRLSRQNTGARTQRCVSAPVPVLPRALLSLVTCVAILICAGIQPAAAQARGKTIDEIFKQLRKGGVGVACVGKVESTGYANAPELGAIDSIGVNVRCDDKSGTGGIAPKAREQAILSVALAAMSTGKSVQIATDGNGLIIVLGLIDGKTR